MRLLLAFAFLPCLWSQVTVACTPAPLAVVRSLHVKEMGPWECFLRNDGPATRTLNPEDVEIGVLAIRPISPATASIILNDHQSHSAAGRVLKILTIAGQASGVVLALVSKANAGLGTALAFGTGFVPQAIQIVQGEVPSTTPFVTNLLTGQITLAPGGTATRMIFCAKQKNPQPIMVKL